MYVENVGYDGITPSGSPGYVEHRQCCPCPATARIARSRFVGAPGTGRQVGRKPASIDASVMQDLETITKSYWRLRANTTSADLMNGVLGHFQTVIELLQHPQPTATFRR